jgi:threonyl-tRNA synthetase
MEQQLEHKRHTFAHLLAAAVVEQYPHAKLTLGPAIDTGFYYDIDFSAGEAPGEDDLKAIQKGMKKQINKWTEWSHEEVSADEARTKFEGNQFKLELIDEIEAKGEQITLYTCGEFTDLCRGGHVENPKADLVMDAFKLDKIAGAYWRGDEKNTMLTRIYGLAFDTKEELVAYEEQVRQAQARDHRKLGKELGLFTFSDTVGKGLPLYTPKGSTIRRILERFIVDEEIKRGYLHVYTPDIAKLDLYKKSGHFPHYKDSMYAPIEIDGDEYMLRPMTCPHHFELYASEPHSYKELPMKIGELAKLYRYEQSGELSGLIRVRSFCLADAHIICKDEEQAVEEVGHALDLIEYVAGVFGLTMGEDFRYELALGDRSDKEKYYDNDAAWDKGENLLRKLMQDRDCAFTEATGEAAFYGPKIDVQMKNVNGKEDTAFTVQYDFCMPERFDLSYIAEDGTKKRALVVHRSSIGALERIMAFLIEHYSGNFPLWLSPAQVAVIPVADVHNEYATNVHTKLMGAGFRSEIDTSSDSMGKKVRRAKKERLPYFLIIGDKDIEANTVTVESRDTGESVAMSIDELLEKLTEEAKV